MSRLPPRPELNWSDDGTPVDNRIGDVYFSKHNGLEETRTVFLQGCGLPDRWAGRSSFTIAELGFGTGLNFLAAWQLWRETRASGQWLHFVSFEGYPLDAEDADRALTAWPELKELAQQLVAAWPERAFGVQRIDWPKEKVSLTLHIGEISQSLPQSKFRADCWFLDGFSPAKNEAMWSESLWPHVRERCEEGAWLSTFTVAGGVRRGLSAAGFDVEKKPGFGRKRERLEVRYTGQRAHAPDVFGLRPPAEPSRAVRVVGAGIAGACVARYLHDRGVEVEVVDRASGPASAASGNPLALMMPRLDAGGTVQARLLIDAYLMARRFYAGRIGVTETDVSHLPKDDREAERISKILADPPLGLENLEALRGGGQLHKRALIIEPQKLLPELLDGISCHFDTEVTANEFDGDHVTILAAGHSLEQFAPWLAVRGRLGQVEAVEVDVDAPASAIAKGDYAVALGRTRLWGATFENWDGGDIACSPDARDRNKAALERLDPYWRHAALQADQKSRAAVRATTPDRLPLIGALPDHKKALELFDGVRFGRDPDQDAPLVANTYVAGGFGSRGFTWAPWAAGILTGQILGEPAPAAKEALQAVCPMRQILRGLKRGSPT
ncbi:MAG: tRNA (5-methylaminomethyl-2-thiouridine)(34)-methyltransferase MnmD [Pseudomonadota bacterium]|nr:tRNA (5-methylaminomethyl-2-thiouridine)(34)-methyltransferase MnmD [Pseudomonadota bacterium]